MMGCLPSSPTVSAPCDEVNLGMHHAAEIKLVWSPKPSVFGDTIGGCDRASLGIDSDVGMERVSR